jgi:hypothetical protein
MLKICEIFFAQKYERLYQNKVNTVETTFIYFVLKKNYEILIFI